MGRCYKPDGEANEYLDGKTHRKDQFRSQTVVKDQTQKATKEHSSVFFLRFRSRDERKVATTNEWPIVMVSLSHQYTRDVTTH